MQIEEERRCVLSLCVFYKNYFPSKFRIQFYYSLVVHHIYITTESVVQGVLKISQNSQKNTFVVVSFLIRLQP